jgi:histidinol-phosphate aminotransferase
MKYWNSTLKNMKEYIPGEQPEDLSHYIKLNTNENPFPPSEHALKAVKAASTGDLRLYPEPTAARVRQLFADQNGLEQENIFVGNGSDEIFTLLFRGFINRDEKAAFPYPSYSLYETLAEANSIEYVKVNLNDDFTVNFKKFGKTKYKLIIIANPNNPTGNAVSIKEIETFLKGYKGLLVVDEAYVDFYGTSAVKLVTKFDNVIVTRSMSKSYSLAGMRIGLAAASRDIIQGLMKIKDSYNINTLSLAAAEAALLDEKTMTYNRDMVINNREYLAERLEIMGFTSVPSQANFIFTKHPNIPSEELYKK